jgi:hypothetical protein
MAFRNNGGEEMEQKPDGYKKIEDQKIQYGTSNAVFEGIKAAQGWKPGKMVTAEEYEKAADAFAAAPMDGREERQHV